MIYIDNDNFTQMIKALQSQSLTENDNHYTILFDKLDKKNQQLLGKVSLPKTKITILTENPSRVPRRYKHQVKREVLYKKSSIYNALNQMFCKGEDALDEFDNRHILAWLTTTAKYYPELAGKVSKLEKYVYSPGFKQLVVNELGGMKCKPRWK